MSIIVGVVTRIAYKRPLNHYRDYVFMRVVNDIGGVDLYCIAVKLSDYPTLQRGLLRTAKHDSKYGNYSAIEGNALLISYTGILEYGGKTTRIPFKSISAIYSIPDAYPTPNKHDREECTLIVSDIGTCLYTEDSL